MAKVVGEGMWCAGASINVAQAGGNIEFFTSKRSKARNVISGPPMEFKSGLNVAFASVANLVQISAEVRKRDTALVIPHFTSSGPNPVGAR